MTNDINTENEKLRKMLEEQKRENEYQKLVIINLQREKELRQANDKISNVYNRIIKLEEEKKLEEKYKGNKRYDDLINNIKNYKKN